MYAFRELSVIVNNLFLKKKKKFDSHKMRYCVKSLELSSVVIYVSYFLFTFNLKKHTSIRLAKNFKLGLKETLKVSLWRLLDLWDLPQ